MSYQSYAVTIRPREGVTDEHIDKFCDWVIKVCDYYYVITEKTDKERHIHAGLFLRSCTTRSNLNNRILAIKGFDFDLTEKKILRQGTRIMYNSDFIMQYCQKEGDMYDRSVQIIDNVSHMPETVMEAYFPEKEDKRMSKEFNGSTWYVKMEQHWKDYEAEGKHCVKWIDEEHVRSFLHQLMYIDRKIEVIDDPRRLAGKVKSLVKFLEQEELQVTYHVDKDVENIMENIR